MYKFIVTIIAVFTMSFVVSTAADAKVRIRGGCASDYAKWKKRGTWGAFAVSRSGTACGASWNWNSRSKARSIALRECKKRGRGCRIVHTSKPAKRFSAKRTNRRAKRFRLSETCRKAHAKWQKQKGHKAFIVSENGNSCHYNWNNQSIDAALSGAREGCISPRDCRVFEIGAPPGFVMAWQRDLQTLGLYDGEIDGKFGKGSQSGMRQFAKLANLKTINSDLAFKRLRWAARLKRELDVEVNEAAKKSATAAKENSLKSLQKPALTKPVERPERETKSKKNALLEQLIANRNAGGHVTKFSLNPDETTSVEVKTDHPLSKIDIADDSTTFAIDLNGDQNGYVLISSALDNLLCEIRNSVVQNCFSNMRQRYSKLACRQRNDFGADGSNLLICNKDVRGGTDILAHGEIFFSLRNGSLKYLGYLPISEHVSGFGTNGTVTWDAATKLELTAAELKVNHCTKIGYSVEGSSTVQQIDNLCSSYMYDPQSGEFRLHSGKNILGGLMWDVYREESERLYKNKKPQPEWIGVWASKKEWCETGNLGSDGGTIQFTKNSYHGLEVSCEITSLSKVNGGTALKLDCSGEGESYTSGATVAAFGEVLTVVHSDKNISHFYRCD